jgi:hypothetical protein
MTTRTAPPALRASDEPGVRFALANVALVMALFVAAAARLQPLEAEVTALVTAVVASAGLAVLLRAAVGVVAWALVTGFVQNSLGQLTFDRADLGRLVLFVVFLGACHHHGAASSPAVRPPRGRGGDRL